MPLWPHGSPTQPASSILAALDARLEPTAYVTDGKNLFEVIGPEGEKVILLNCSTMHRAAFDRDAILQRCDLVKAAVVAPDSPEALAA